MPKSNKCTICTSPFMQQVDEMLSKGINYPTIVKFLKDKAIPISTTSVMRHNNNHRKPKLAKKTSKPKKSSKKSAKKPKSARNSKQAQTDIINVQKPERELAAFERDLSKIKKRRNKVLKNIADMSQDIDVLEKMSLAVQLSEDRLFRALEEEQDTKMVLNVTSGAFKDYSKALKDYHEATAGMDSATQVRFAQLVNMVGNVFVQTSISDKARAELLETINEYDIDNLPDIDVNENVELVEDTKDKQIEEVIIPKPDTKKIDKPSSNSK